VRGASGVFDEVDEARRVVEHLADELSLREVEVGVFHDDTSHDQKTNLHTIVDAHNDSERDLDVSVHFNAFDGKAHGVEVCHVTQHDLAAKVSAAIAGCGFADRGPKERTELYFLNHTDAPAILIEVCFCDNAADAATYREKFHAICVAIADVLGGKPAELIA
jgi:N-acetylmuramoyl-L-alanine amidase